MALQPVGSKSVLDESKKTGYTYKGMEIVLSKTRGHPMNLGKGMFGIPDSKRIEVATLWAVLGNVKQVSELTEIKASTVREWSRQEWFRTLLEEIRSENDEKIDAQTTDIIDKALDSIQDRIANGDYVLTKMGELKRKPIGIRDLSITAAIVIDKRQLLRGKPTSRTESVTSEQTLAKLADTFTKLTNKTKELPVIEDVEFTEVKKDESASDPT